MFEQLFPPLLQRVQTYLKLVAPVQAPSLAVSVLPSCAVPEIDGGVVFTGLAVAAATPEPANAESEATTIAATPAPKAAPTAAQRFLCVVCISYPFHLL